jgi:uncharacterized membrane protein
MTELDRHGSDRIIAFSDGVVAIAITVLLLPLAELRATDGDVLGMLQDNAELLGGLSLTWAIIALFWFAHHRIFDHIEAVDRPLMWLNFLWLFAIALLPLPTNTVIANDPSRQVTGFYIGWMTLISLLLALIFWHARRTPGLTPAGYAASPGAREGQVRSIGITGGFLACFLLSLVAPDLALYFLLLQIAVDPIAARIARRRG